MMIYIVLSLVAFCSSVQCSKTIIAGTSSLYQLPGQRQQFPSFLSRKGNNEQNSSKAPSEEIDPHYETHYIAQYLDHFDVREERFFRQRYLLSRAYWGSPVQPFKYTNVGYCPGPILFYTGNESPVTAYWSASGFITKRLAQAWGALVVFAEHRYFGKSIPQMFENPWEPDAIKYLSPEQALADYAHLITDLKERLNVSFCPVLSFGGSYGGMLTAWFRGKYPHIVLGGLAASAPFGFVKTTSFNPYSFMDAAQETIKNAGGVTQSNPSLTCDIMMKNEFQRILTESQTKDGALRLSKEFELCEPLSGPDVGLQFVSYIQNALVTATMLDYPYSVDYGIPLPGHPVNRICEDTKTFGLGPSLKKNFWDLENKKKCLDVARDVPDFDAGQGWNYLACSEVYMPIAQRGMWIPETKWSVLNDIDACRQTFNITLRPESITERYFSGFNFVTGASRIIFSNGLLDPWHAMGVLISLSDSLIAIVMPNGAHHLDLREDNKEDPEDVKEARAQEQKIMESWLHDYYYGIRKED